MSVVPLLARMSDIIKIAKPAVIDSRYGRAYPQRCSLKAGDRRESVFASGGVSLTPGRGEAMFRRIEASSFLSNHCASRIATFRGSGRTHSISSVGGKQDEPKAIPRHFLALPSRRCAVGGLGERPGVIEVELGGCKSGNHPRHVVGRSAPRQHNEPDAQAL